MSNTYEVGTRAWQKDPTVGWVPSEVQEKVVNGDKVRLVFRLENDEVRQSIISSKNLMNGNDLSNFRITGHAFYSHLLIIAVSQFNISRLPKQLPLNLCSDLARHHCSNSSVTNEILLRSDANCCSSSSRLEPSKPTWPLSKMTPSNLIYLLS